MLRRAVLAGIRLWLHLYAPPEIKAAMTRELAEKLAAEIVYELKAE